AYQLERHWDKDKILTEYLNEIYFGEGAYGIEEAAKTYFGWNHPGCGESGNRCASQLFPWEAAMLGGLISNPSGYDPRVDPGAAFKPFTLVTALEQGRSPDEVFTSAPQQLPYKAEIPTKHGKPKVVNELFDVHNYGDEYQGSASLATATTFSDNSVFSQLGMSLSGGPAAIAATANKMGIQTDLATTDHVKYSVNGSPFEPYNPALILGGLE